MRYLKTFISGIWGGIAIAIGGVAYLSLESKLAGAIFFCVGLFIICTFGLNLFTGKVCYLFEQDRTYALGVPLIWLGNLGGTALVGSLLRATRLSGLSLRAAEVCESKLTDSYLSLFLLAIFCNILIFIAVDGFKNNPHELGKYLSLFFGVTVFILCGFEHCVADMFYFTAAGVWSLNTLLRLLIITLGNALGAVLLPLCLSWLKDRTVK